MKSNDHSEPNFIDLGSIRTNSLAADPTSFQAAVIAAIPSPDGLTAAQYAGKLQIPSLDAEGKEDSASLYYLLKDDLYLLCDLLQAGVSTFGRWRAQSSQLLEAGIMTPEQQLQLNIRGQILGAFLESWQQGRGNHLDSQTLKDSDILSDKMLKLAREILVSEKGNAEKFMARVNKGDVKRLQSSKKEELQTYLELNGFIDKRPRLNSEQMVNHVVLAVTSELAAGKVKPADIRNLTADLEIALSSK